MCIRDRLKVRVVQLLGWLVQSPHQVWGIVPEWGWGGQCDLPVQSSIADHENAQPTPSNSAQEPNSDELMAEGILDFTHYFWCNNKPTTQPVHLFFPLSTALLLIWAGHPHDSTTIVNAETGISFLNWFTDSYMQWMNSTKNYSKMTSWLSQKLSHWKFSSCDISL